MSRYFSEIGRHVSVVNQNGKRLDFTCNFIGNLIHIEVNDDCRICREIIEQIAFRHCELACEIELIENEIELKEKCVK